MTKTAGKPNPLADKSPGVIEPHALYTVVEARRRLRIGDWAWRKWLRNGLIVLRLSRRAYVRGSTLIQFIEQHGGEQEQGM